MDTTVLLWVLALVIVAIGLAGLILPALPGAPLVFAGLFLAAWAENFAYVGLRTLLILGFLALLVSGVDWWAAMYGTKRFGASNRAVVGALIGSIVGVFLGFPGILFCPFIGAVIGELSARRGLHDAARAGVGATIGLVLGAALKLALTFTMIGIFVVVRFL
jgi:uncharacterized protein YqgC (DUF456 family)